MAAENKVLVEKLTAGGYYFLGEQDLLDALTLAIAHSHSGVEPSMQLGLGLRTTKPDTDPSTRAVWKKDARMILSHQLGSLGIRKKDQAR
ncbi:MAG: hypothetical protein HETSPECPRED_010329 [Heterodermia speciosa]|uniref:Uncharacterized protein n=1 Tax=Heterodermia speciosa TaxID=116794 RepID=A0A8H3G8A0_9LECA|nr:MAG: hypothetical protein HETSPECPRED_010329 [Heterodermia speciosa]